MAKSEPHGSSQIFVSYRHEDAGGYVLALLPALRNRFGHDRIVKEIVDTSPSNVPRKLESYSMVLVVIGPDWLTVPSPSRKGRAIDDPDDYVRRAIAAALKIADLLVLPVLVGRGTMPASEELPPDLESLSLRNAFELSDVRWNGDVSRLLTTIELLMEGRLTIKQRDGEPIRSSATASESERNEDFSGHGQQRQSDQAANGKETLTRRIFLCYRRADSATIVGRIYDRLEKEFGRKNIFKDVDNIPFGVDFVEHLDREVEKCDVLFAVIGKRWLRSRPRGAALLDDPNDFVRIEIASALRRTIPVVPILVDGARMPLENQLPEEIKALARRHGTDVRHDPDFHADMTRLLSRIG